MTEFNRGKHQLKRMKEHRYDAREWQNESRITASTGKLRGFTVSLHSITRKMSLNAFTRLFDDFLNLGGKRWREGFQVGINLTNTHRTLQGNAVEFCLGILAGIAQQEYTDARNEHAVATAKKITAMRDNGELDHQRYT